MRETNTRPHLLTDRGRGASLAFVDGVDEIQQIIGDVTKNGRNVRENTDKINIEYDGYRVTISKTIRSHKGIFTIKRCIFHQRIQNPFCLPKKTRWEIHVGPLNL